MFWRSLLAPRVAATWREFLEAYHRRAGAPAPEARALAKPLRSYLHGRFGPRRRLSSLLDHYGHMDAYFHSAFIARLCAGEAIAIARLRGRRDRDYDLSLVSSIQLRTQREGELAIQIVGAHDGLALCRLSFAFAEADGQPCLVIGGVQGPVAGNKRAIIDATRDLHGLRPKDAALLALRAFARRLGSGVVHAVSDANHVLSRLQDQAKHSSYDDYWVERGAQPGGPFGYQFGVLHSDAAAGAREKLKQDIVAAVDALLDANLLAPNRRPANAEPTAAREMIPA